MWWRQAPQVFAHRKLPFIEAVVAQHASQVAGLDVAAQVIAP